MNSLVVCFFAFIASVGAQTVLEIQAAGALPDGSSAVAQGEGRGQNVVGDAIAQVTQNAATSSTLIQATGPSLPAPTPTPKPVVITPKPVIIASKPVVVSKQYTVAPICSDIKDKQCPKIDDFKLCGFCLLQSYPVVKGYACNYQESYVLDKKVSDKYEVVITPLCKCNGKFIMEGKACPSCDKLLAALLRCAGSKKSSGVIEIPEKCLKQVGATEKILKDCGFLGAAKPYAVDQKKPVIVVKPKKPVVVVPVTTSTVVVPAVATSTASATASTASSTAQSTAIAQGASTNAVASATASGN